jgi:hypothetical protein
MYGTNDHRVTGHLPLMLAFVGLFIVTTWSLIKNDIIGLFLPSWHGPMLLYDPFKILANVSAVACFSVSGSCGRTGRNQRVKAPPVKRFMTGS